MFVTRVRAGVTFDVIAPAGFRLLAAIDRLTTVVPHDVIITSGTDSHTAPDPHATGEAYDIGVSGWTPGEILAALLFLQTTLGPAFTVLYEVPRLPLDPALAAVAYVNVKATGPHFHLQRCKGTSWP